jgi:hypothetical protein
MRTSYTFALNHVNFSIGDENFDIDSIEQDIIVSIGNSIVGYDVHNFNDRMSIDTPTSRDNYVGYSKTTVIERVMDLMDYFPVLTNLNVGIGSTTPYVGYDTVQTCLENVTKAMLIAILENNAKRGYTVGIGSTISKKNKFYNCLAIPEYRNSNIQPWNNWNTPIGICTPVSIARTDNVATVITNPPHGMSTSYDDWGIVMNLNTGIATSFNISTSIYPNGVPIKIVSPTSFKYKNIGINTTIASVSGISSICVGWGGTSNHLHLKII